MGGRRAGRARARTRRVAARPRHLGLHCALRAAAGEGKARRRGADHADQPLLRRPDRHRCPLRRRRAQVQGRRAPHRLRRLRSRGTRRPGSARDAAIHRGGRHGGRIERRPRRALDVRRSRLGTLSLLSPRPAPTGAARVRAVGVRDARARGRRRAGRGAGLAAYGRGPRGLRRLRAGRRVRASRGRRRRRAAARSGRARRSGRRPGRTRPAGAARAGRGGRGRGRAPARHDGVREVLRHGRARRAPGRGGGDSGRSRRRGLRRDRGATDHVARVGHRSGRRQALPRRRSSRSRSV